MDDLPRWGFRQLFVMRILTVIAATIPIQFVFMTGVVLVTNLNILHPLSWIRDTWTIITSFRMWCWFVLLACLILLHGAMCVRNYCSSKAQLKSRFGAFCDMFNKHNFLLVGLNVAVGVVIVWLHLSLEGGRYSSLSAECKTTRGFCLVEEHDYLLLGGLWNGIYYFPKTNIFDLPHLSFPIIPQSKFNRVKRGVGSLLPSAMIGAVWPTLYLLGFYYFLGGYFRSFVASTLFLNVESEPLDGISRLLNPSLIFHSWLYAALFALSMNTMHLMFEVFHTEGMSFSVERGTLSNGELSGVTLSEALAMEKVLLIQYLGYMNLVTLAQSLSPASMAQRELIFTLSQPGGHPYNWNSIVEKCLTLLRNFAGEINDVSSARTESPALTATSEAMEKTCTYHMRNLASAQISHPSGLTQTNAKTEETSERLVVGYFKSKRDNFVSYLLSKPLIFYFFGKQSDSKIRHSLMIRGQPVIWAADAISSLAVASLREDPYGVVQKDLPAIIEALLSLKQSLDKLQKTNLLMRKPQNDDRTIRQTLTSLRTAIKRSIYRIVTNFKDYIDDLALEPTVRDQLQSFLAYRE